MNVTRTPEHQTKIDRWNERQRQSRANRLAEKAVDRSMTQEIDSFAEQEEKHDLWWTVAYRETKRCRLCSQLVPLDLFDKAAGNLDRLKNECKRCSYDRYVKPRLPERAARTRTWQRANPEKTKASRRKHSRKPHMKARHSLIKRLKKLIGSKSEHYADLIGCTPKALVAHLESLFKPGMSWENTGEWHIDHKVPCRAFDLAKREERLRCFHWSNLQPLWAAENAAKSDQMPDGSNARDLA